jgi:hypothetical protein
MGSPQPKPEGQPESYLAQRPRVDAPAAHRGIDGEGVADLTDRADEARAGALPAEFALVEDLCDRPHGLIMRPFADRADEDVAMLLARDRIRQIHMQRASQRSAKP